MLLSQRDKKLIWHPFTQEKTAQDVLAIQKARGSYVYDENGKAYLDLISSWWVNLHGHGHEGIAKKIYDQAQTLEHVLFAGCTHEPAVALCEALQKILPPSLTRFFFSDNGSTAVEVALKMAYQYWQNRGVKERRLFLSFEGGYHGDTVGAMSVGAKSGFHNIFSDLFFDVLSLPYPETWEDDPDVTLKEHAALNSLEEILKKQGNRVAGLIMEPLVQGARGMRFCRSAFIKEVMKRVEAFDILVIFDEVMTGFGRTGKNFALDHVDIVPDFLCVSKGITGGFLPLGLTVTTETVYEAFLNDSWDYAFLHGHSYTANPLACAAAGASLELLLSDSCQTALKEIEDAHRYGLATLQKRCPFIERKRILGTIGAFDVPQKGSLSLQDLRKKCLEVGLLLRPLGSTLYLLPPYCTSGDVLREAYEKISDILSPPSIT